MLNLVALAGLVINTSFSIFFIAVDLVGARPVLLSNVLSNIGYLATIWLNSRGLSLAAVWVFFFSAVLNLGVAGSYFGLATGGWVYLLMLPVTAALFVPRGRPVTAAAVVGGGSLAFAITPLFAGSVPDFISGPIMRPALTFVVLFSTAAILAAIAYYYRTVAERAEAESEALLLNVFPPEIAERLKSGESPIADRIEDVTVVFADIVGSTEMADQMDPDDLVMTLNGLFSSFDGIVDACGLEKIKTVGDEYIAVAGLTQPVEEPVAAAARAALLMQEETERHRVAEHGPLYMRFGLHTGTVVAGVIGRKRFSYDMWGDTVNTASRMESRGQANAIQVSTQVYNQLKDTFRLEARGTIPMKGKGELQTYLLLGPR